MVTAAQFEVKVLLIPGDNGFTAQCLEYDLATQAEDELSAIYELYRSVLTTLSLIEAGRFSRDDLSDAPAEYFARFEVAPRFILDSIRREKNQAYQDFGELPFLDIRVAPEQAVRT